MENFGFYLVMTNPVVGYEECARAAVKAGVKIIQRRFAFGLPKPIVVKARGFPVGGEKTLTLRAATFIILIFFHFREDHMCTFRKLFDSLAERTMLHFHIEVKDIAPCFTAETIV